MDAADILAMYRSMCLQTVIVRRFSSLALGRTAADFTGAGNAVLYGATDLVDAVKQGDQRVIVIADDLAASGLALPVVKTDRVVVDGRELSIESLKTRKALDGTVIAYEIQARG
jgi:hypothetical protein